MRSRPRSTTSWSRPTPPTAARSRRSRRSCGSTCSSIGSSRSRRRPRSAPVRDDGIAWARGGTGAAARATPSQVRVAAAASRPLDAAGRLMNDAHAADEPDPAAPTAIDHGSVTPPIGGLPRCRPHRLASPDRRPRLLTIGWRRRTAPRSAGVGRTSEGNDDVDPSNAVGGHGQRRGVMARRRLGRQDDSTTAPRWSDDPQRDRVGVVRHLPPAAPDPTW